MKSNVTRTLEAQGIAHQQVEYLHVADAIDAISVADRIGVDRACLFKTLVARGDRSGPVVFCLPGSMELDLKKAAAITDNKRITLIPSRELLPTTGYVRGACSPIGMTRPLPTWIDETATLFEQIYISAGIHGVQIRIAPQILCEFIGARFADVT